MANSNQAKSFQFIEETLHYVPLFIGVEIAVPRFGTIALRWNGKYSVLLRDIFMDVLRTVSLVTKKAAAGNVDTQKHIQFRFGIVYLLAVRIKCMGSPKASMII